MEKNVGKMRFRGHETFFVRKGWLYKGMKNVDKDEMIFRKSNEAMDILGIGSNMVKSLRYWMQAFDLTKENGSGIRIQTFTPFGEIVYENDRYIEEIGTLWLLHYKLSTNYGYATSWYHFFNEFKMSEFTRDDFVTQLEKYKSDGDSGSVRVLEDDFNCIINTYVSRTKSNPEKVQPESNIDCPLGELGLIDIVNKNYKDSFGRRQVLYKKSMPKKDTIHPLIMLAVILEQANKKKEVRISEIQNDKNNVGKVFNLDIISIISLLSKLEHMEYIKVERTAGLDIVKINTKYTFDQCIKEYYRIINL